MSKVTRRHALALGGSSLLLPSAVRAQANWPAGPVTFVVGYAAGGSTDINARELAQVMTPVIGSQIVIENKGGAAGSIGLRAVAAAKPDGQTIFVAVGTNVIINPHAAWYSEQAMAGLQRGAPSEVRRVLEGEWPVNVVNKAVKGKSRAGL